MSWMNNNFNPEKHQLYSPTYPKKYVGKNKNIVVRSSYEAKFCRWLDLNPNVLEWASEALEIEYYDPTVMKKRRYFPDFYMKVKDKDGKIKKYIIEIKPNKETYKPIIRKNKKPTALLQEQKKWEVNQAKWKAAVNWCNKFGFEFKIVTEKQLFG